MTTEPTPAQQVLLTVELAEQVLSYLPFQDLINCELVCRAWYSIIQTSPHVRQGLFLEPSSHALSMAYQSNSKLRKPWQWRTLNVKRYTETYTIALLHPYLTSNPTKEGRGRIAFTFPWQQALSVDPNLRWSRMFVTQPPCRNVKMDFQVGSGVDFFKVTERVSDPKGVRLGLLVDKIDQITQSYMKVLPIWGSLRGASLDCFVDGFISETAAFALASRAAAAACASSVGGG